MSWCWHQFSRWERKTRPIVFPPETTVYAAVVQVRTCMKCGLEQKVDD